MKIYSYHLLETSPLVSLKTMANSPNSKTCPGLIHAECMTKMRLGAPVISADRMQLSKLAMFAAWENEEALDRFMNESKLGRELSDGWHVRMEFMRRWSSIKALGDMPETAVEGDPNSLVIAVTLARMKFPEIPRFLKWGRPVEKQVRDAPGVILAMAAMRLPNTVSTFTIWNSQQSMVDMVRGHSQMERPERHFVAMKERNRRDFHFEFATLRFRPISEHGAWEGRTNLTQKI